MNHRSQRVKGGFTEEGTELDLEGKVAVLWGKKQTDGGVTILAEH